MIETDQNTHRSTRFRLQEIAAKILPDSSTSYCLKRQQNGNTSVWKNDETGKARYTGLMTCGSRWVCPVCAAKKAVQSANEIKAGLAGGHYKTYLVTYTLQHKLGDRLDTLIADLNECIAYMRNGAKRKRFDDAFGSIGFIRSLEVRYSHTTGWHPHIHELLICKPHDGNQSQAIHEKIIGKGGYGSKLADKGYLVNQFTVDVRTNEDCATGNVIDDYLTKSSIELELTGNEQKQGASLSPFQLLHAYETTGDCLYQERFEEYSLATAGKQQTRWSKGLRNLLQCDEEEEEKESSEMEQLLATLDRTEWQKICEMSLRATLLDKAEKLSPARFRQWLRLTIYGGVESSTEKHPTRQRRINLANGRPPLENKNNPPYMGNLLNEIKHLCTLAKQ